jgi:KUP system potassium uptake protein
MSEPEAPSPSPPEASHEHEHGHGHGHAGGLRALALGALGIVYGDIGTSPLYALKECVHGEHAVAARQANVLGLLSLIFWAITLVVTVKYLTFVMRADNRGEGGILSLLALVPERYRFGSGGSLGWLAALVVFGAALLYGDGIITPAISVLSAMEGLEVATSTLKPVVVPITCVVLAGLFAIQKRGTAKVGRLFGPVMLIWFLTIGGLGVYHLTLNPAVLHALNPAYAVRFFAANGMHGFVVLGSVVLAITGGEALYADMGHFGRRPIKAAWYGMVMPALVLNYFGQGANLLAHPEAAANPFYALVPTGVFTYVLVALASSATVIASQALITGAFSLTHQAVQLGFLPRVTIKHTSHETEGQIYIPEVNVFLALACIGLVLQFQSSSRLAAAYGIAVTGTMAITSVVYFVVVRRTWGWPLWKALPLLIFFLACDLPFFASNLLKFFHGGYVPLVIGVGLFLIMVTWRSGRNVLAEDIVKKAPPLEEFLANLDVGSPAVHAADGHHRADPAAIASRCQARVPGSSVFLASTATRTPTILLHHVRHNKVLHQTVVLLTVVTEHVPKVKKGENVDVEDLGKGFYRVIMRCGFMQSPNVPSALHVAAKQGAIPLDFRDMTYYIGHETFLATKRGKMGPWAESLFAFLSRNARSASAYFSIPPKQVVEIGMQLDL